MDVQRSSAIAWLGTLNNPGNDVDPAGYLSDWYYKHGCVYVNGQVERAPTTGTVHIQFYLLLPRSQRLSWLTKRSGGVHWTPVLRDNGASDYCLKEESRIDGPWEFGTKPPKGKSSGKIDWDTVRKQAETHQWDDIPSEVYIKHHHSLKKIGTEKLNPKSFDQVRGIWLWGPPGTGKTTFARTEYSEDVYVKPQSKWWDGYTTQSTVVLDDLDTPVLAHYLKIWADKWSATGEVKHGTVPLNYERFIVTSNFSIEGLHKDCPPETIAAIQRRFKVIHFNHPLGSDQV